jgi:hypothetical protein
MQYLPGRMGGHPVYESARCIWRWRHELMRVTAIAELRALLTLGLTVRVFPKTNDFLLAVAQCSRLNMLGYRGTKG